jgi:hypothetical protein
LNTKVVFLTRISQFSGVAANLILIYLLFSSFSHHGGRVSAVSPTARERHRFSIFRKFALPIGDDQYRRQLTMSVTVIRRAQEGDELFGSMSVNHFLGQVTVSR